jgi:ADP-heptose:LPS heptosyltransferase
MPVIYPAIIGARQELRGEGLRRLAALMSVSKKYLGTNTGFMHMAACFGDDNFVFAHSEHEGKPWWLYPKDNHFWENESVETVIQRIGEKWL